MCGRYALHDAPEVVALQFALDAVPEFRASYNVCPGSEVLVVRPDREGRRVAAREPWGRGGRLANARGETLAEKPAFRDAFLRRRCLVPASGFYEWQGVAGYKQPWYLRPADAELFGLAGILSLWNAPQGPGRSVSLITTQPNELIASIHDRMPVIVPPEGYGAWLDPAKSNAESLKAFLQPYPAERMRAHPVSRRVSTPANDDPGLIEELANAALPPGWTRRLL